MDITLRRAVTSDADFLIDMVVAAAFWRPDGPSGSRDDVLSVPELAHYVAGWPQPGDLGVVAEAAEPIGAAWLRFFTAEDPGYGFIDAAVPELSMGVAGAWRGRGVGRSLLSALIAAARDAEMPAISLSVETDNFALRLYQDVGFRPVRAESGAVTMKLQL